MRYMLVFAMLVIGCAGRESFSSIEGNIAEDGGVDLPINGDCTPPVGDDKSPLTEEDVSRYLICEASVLDGTEERIKIGCTFDPMVIACCGSWEHLEHQHTCCFSCRNFPGGPSGCEADCDDRFWQEVNID